MLYNFRRFLQVTNDKSIIIVHGRLLEIATDKCVDLCTIDESEILVEEDNIKLFFERILDTKISDEMLNCIIRMLSGSVTLEDSRIIGQNPTIQSFFSSLYGIDSQFIQTFIESNISEIFNPKSTERRKSKLYYLVPYENLGDIRYFDECKDFNLVGRTVGGIIISTPKKIDDLFDLSLPLDVLSIPCLIRNPKMRNTQTSTVMDFEIFYPNIEVWVRTKMKTDYLEKIVKWRDLIKSKTNCDLIIQAPSESKPKMKILANILTKAAKDNEKKETSSVESKINAAIEKFVQENHHLLKLTYNKEDAERDPSGNTIYIEGENVYLTSIGVIKPILELIKPITRNKLKTIWNADVGPKNRYPKEAQKAYWIVKIQYIENLINYLNSI